MSSTIDQRALANLQAVVREHVAARRVTETATVQAVQADSGGYIRSAVVRLLDGSQDVTLPLHGAHVTVGQGVLLSREVGRPAAAAWRFEGYTDANTPFPSIDADLSIPPPGWGSPALESRTLAGAVNGQVVRVVAHIVETPEKYGPRETEVRYQYGGVGAPWSKVVVRNVAAVDFEHEVELPDTFTAGTAVNVQARTLTHGSAFSDWSELRTLTVTATPITPTAPAPATVDLTINLTAKINLPAPTRPDVFGWWEIQLAGDAAGGAGSYPGLLPRTDTETGRQHLVSLPAPGNVYLRIREVTRYGVAGPFWPASGYSGPYAVLATDTQPPDTTPPTAPTIASAVASQGFDANGNVFVIITVTLAAYSPPADFATFVYNFHNGAAFEDRTSQVSPYQLDHARQGVTYQVRARAVDRTGNSSGFSNTVAVATPTLAQPPTPGAAPTVTPAYRAAVIAFAPTPSSTAHGVIAQYDLQRSPNTGDPAQWLTVANIPAPPAGQLVRWVDAGPLANGQRLAANTAYGWRYRPVNDQGVPSATWSPHTVAVTLAVDGADLVVGSVLANRLEATLDLVAGRKITVASGGTIEAAGGNIVMNNSGLDVKNATAIRFINALAQVKGWLGISTVPGTALDAMRAMFEEIVLVSNASPDHFIRITPEAGVITFYLDGIAAYRVGWEAGLQRLLGGVWRKVGWNHIPTPGPVISLVNAVANTDYDFNATSYGVPSGARAVYIRGSVALRTAGGHVYAYAAGGNFEAGMYATHATANARVPWAGPPVPLINDVFRLRGFHNFDCDVMVVGYEW
jgi:hypothetical protein